MSEHEPTPLSPQQALKLMQDDPRAVLVDIRSSMEFLFVGHPHQDQVAIQHRSKEHPACARCEHTIPLRTNGTTVLSRVLEQID